MNANHKKNNNPSGVTQNIAWTLHKGAFLSHFLIIFIGYLILRSLLDSHNMALMILPLLYNISTLIFFHLIIGDPFYSQICSSDYKNLTFWEQMVEQIGYKNSTMFFIICPIILYFLVNHLVLWNKIIHIFNLISLIIVLIPKCGFMHRKRMFGVGK